MRTPRVLRSGGHNRTSKGEVQTRERQRKRRLRPVHSRRRDPARLAAGHEGPFRNPAPSARAPARLRREAADSRMSLSAVMQEAIREGVEAVTAMRATRELEREWEARALGLAS